MDETLYAIQYNRGGTPMAIGTITYATFCMIYDDCDEHLTELNMRYNRLEKTITTEDYAVYKLARQLHRESINTK